MSYHVFPRNADRKQRWVQAVKRHNIAGSNWPWDWVREAQRRATATGQTD